MARYTPYVTLAAAGLVLLLLLTIDSIFAVPAHGVTTMIQPPPLSWAVSGPVSAR